MSAAIVISILANASQANATFDKTTTKAQKVGKSFRSMALPAAGALAAVGALAKGTLDAASDSQQSIGATESVFKDYADTVIKRSEKANEVLGISANQYRELSTVTGAMLKNSGMPLRKVADLTDKLNRRAADLAATYGGTTKDAVEAVSSLLRGEADPIERYGVSIKQVDVNARLAAKGQDKLTGASKKQAEQQARLDLLMKQTKDTQGQFARESDTAANKAQKNAAKWADLQAELGNKLLPVYVKLQERGMKTLDWLSEHQNLVSKVVVVVAALAAGVLVVNAAMKVGAAVTAVYNAAVKASELAHRGATNAHLGTRFGLMGLAVQQKASTASTQALDLATGQAGRSSWALRGATLAGGAALVGLSQYSDNASGSLGKVGTVAGSVAAGFAVGGPWGGVIAGGLALLGVGAQSEESAERQQAFLDIQSRITTQAQTLTGTLNAQTGAITKLTRETVAKSLADNGAFASADKIGVSYGTVTKAALGNAKAQATVERAMKRYATEQRNAAKGMDGLIEASGRVEAVAGPLEGSINQFSSSLKKARTAASQTEQAIREMADGAGGAAGRMAQAGGAAGSGFYHGLYGWLDNITAVGVMIGERVAQAARDKLKIQSPSRVMRQIGVYVGEGLADGIFRSTPTITRAVNRSGVNTKKEYLKQARDITKALLSASRDRYKQLAAQEKDYARGVADAAKDYASLSNIQLGENETLTADRILQDQNDKLAAINNFNTKLYRLRKAGLSKEMYDQIAQMGVEEGTAYVEALSSATPATLRGINSVGAQIGKASNRLGKNTADTMYGAGVDAAKGFHDGLASMLKKIDKQGVKISKTLVKALKKALGIKSPSRVLRRLGVQSVDGLDDGLDARRIQVKGKALAQSLTKGYANPVLDAQFRAGFIGSAKAEKPAQVITNYITVHVKVDNSMTQEQQGVAINDAIEAAKRARLIPA